MTGWLDLDDLLVDAVDGEVAARDHGLLRSRRGRLSDAGAEAAVLLHSWVRNHALVDGDKRLAGLASVVFLEIDGTALVVGDDDAVTSSSPSPTARWTTCPRSLRGWRKESRTTVLYRGVRATGLAVQQP